MSRRDLSGGWIDRVMSYVITPSFSVWTNRKANDNISPSKGLQQGGSLSPYLFLLCAEGFFSLLAKAEEEGRLHGVSICRRAPSISHLLFVDDLLLFCRANQEKVHVISEVLQTYASPSSHCINFEKSSVHFINNTRREQMDRIKMALGIREVV